jgi:hypothetical protein
MKIDVTAHGIDPASTADQTSAINALLSSYPSGTCFYFPSGTYLVAGLGQGCADLHDVDIKGDGANSTVFKSPPSPTANSILAVPVGSVSVSIKDIKFDAANQAGILYSVYAVSSDDIDVIDCKFVNWNYIAVAINSVVRYRVLRNRIIRPATGGIGQTQTNTIAVASTARASSNGMISENFQNGAGMHISSANTMVNGNLVVSYAYGAGLATSREGHGGLFLASGNMLIGGIGKDSDGTFPSGAELNTDYTSFIGNVVAANAGEGVSSCGYASHIAANYATMNGNGSDGAGGGAGITDVQRAGIVLATLPGQTGASASSVLANRSFDGGSGHQKYGYYEFLLNGPLSGVKVLGNDLANNAVGNAYIGSPSTTYDGQ